MIVFEDVYFSYGTRSVLKGLTFKVKESERVAILGGSGEGKTTILKLIVGLLKPDSGRILIDGEDITLKEEDELMDIRKKFSIVFQDGALFDSLNVKENVAFCLREYTKMSEEEIEQKVRELLRIVGIEEAIYYMPDELSGGMHRRVAIARSLAVTKPKMFLYDEATTGLDPINAENICQLINELSKDGTGHIIVTHKLVDALRVAERFIFLKDGRIVFDGNIVELKESQYPDLVIFKKELQYVI
ncbi:MAG: ATP-binding cassette domain-containing protein [Thermodesulfovibrionales bacterium]|nr:ATP-binding cassette domain-containing protein [Thermodesulfovibrionales bacterium]